MKTKLSPAGEAASGVVSAEASANAGCDEHSGAVRSGYLAAEALLDREGVRRSYLLPDIA